MQVGAGYLVDSSFLKEYEEYGPEYIHGDDFWYKHQIPVKQAKYDRNYLYGILLASNSSRDHQAILKHKRSADGIATWISFLKSYAHDGSVELKLDKLEQLIATPFSHKHPGGMEHYIDLFQANMENIDTLDPGSFTEQRKKRLLLNNVRHVHGIAHLVQKCKDDPTMSFEETANY